MAPKRTIYLLRHGEREAEGDRRLIGQLDVPLNEQVSRLMSRFSTKFRRKVRGHLWGARKVLLTGVIPPFDTAAPAPPGALDIVGVDPIQDQAVLPGLRTGRPRRRTEVADFRADAGKGE